jgi:hypothetical protein
MALDDVKVESGFTLISLVPPQSPKERKDQNDKKNGKKNGNNQSENNLTGDDKGK